VALTGSNLKERNLMGAKESLALLIVPIGLALLPLIWTYFSSRWRRIQFQNLIYREIEEAGPYPDSKCEAPPKHYTRWINHHPQKRFLHVEILEKPTENRDFILALRSNFVYIVTQLWKSKDNPHQWLHFLNEIEKQMPILLRRKQKTKIRKAKIEWYKVIVKYDAKFKLSITEEEKREMGFDI
jgi:hypothetical protein